MKNSITLQEKFKELQQQKKALLATNFYNFETLKGVLQAARSVKKPDHTSTYKKLVRIFRTSGCHGACRINAEIL